MIITTTDPITGENLPHPETRPFVIEGKGHLAVKIYFESEETRRAYLDTGAGHPGAGPGTNLRDPGPGPADLN